MTDSSRAAAALPTFTAVPRKHTVSHGWTVDKQRDFIAALAATGSVRLAAEAVQMSHCGVYKLRHAPGGGSFARAWDIAVGMGAARIRDVLFDQAIHGIPETVITGKDTRIERRKFNHRTMIWALQHHMPDQYPGGSKLEKKGSGTYVPTAIDLAEAHERVFRRFDGAQEEKRRAMIELSGDPAKRAAYDLLHPDHDYDWDALMAEGRLTGTETGSATGVANPVPVRR